MDLDAKVDVVPHRVAVHADRVYGVPYLARVSLEVWDISVFVQKRRQVADGGEPLRLGVLYPLHQRLARFSEDVVIDSRLVPRLAAEELVGRHAEVLARDVPHGDVERAQRAHDRGSPEVGVAVHVLPVVLDS